MSRQSNVLIQFSVGRIQAAAMKLQASKFSESAIATFRQNVSGQLKRDGRDIAQMGWFEGKGKEQDFDPGRYNDYISEQLEFLDGWVSEIRKAGALPGGVGRAALYGESLGQVYQRYYVAARGARVGLPDLPAYPRDGSTVCRVRCRCQWKIVKRDNELYEATWQMGQAEHCPDCIERSKTWAPLRLIYMRDEGVWRQFTRALDGGFVEVQ